MTAFSLVEVGGEVVWRLSMHYYCFNIPAIAYRRLCELRSDPV